jgi:uncharacterized protein (DUF305 family)
MSRLRILAFALAVLSMTDSSEPLNAGAATSKTNVLAIEGAAFDRAFTDQMIKDHQEAIDLIHAQADDASQNKVSKNGRS